MIKRSEEALTVVDLFCGAGGLSCGLQRAGFRTVWAADIAESAVRTYARNIGDHVEQLALTEQTDVPGAHLYVGGPPCQGFSSAGLRKPDDHRNSLVAVYASLIAQHRPAAFLFENVEGFLTGDAGRHVFELLEPVIAAGYRVHLRKVNAGQYGVPQHRKRVLAIGGLGWTPSFPSPTHRPFGAPGAKLGGEGLPPTPTVVQALVGLPTPTEGPPGDPPDHYARPLEGDALTVARALAPGQTMKDLPEALWHRTYRRRAFRRVKDGTPTERRGGAPAGKRRLHGEQPSKAITGGARSEFLHPSEDRHLSLRECARIQTFEDSFVFEGTASQRALLIGNAVPPRLAEAVGRHLIQQMTEIECTDEPGELLSFVPTLSNGMSPALQNVTRRVRERFGLVVGERLLWD